MTTEIKDTKKHLIKLLHICLRKVNASMIEAKPYWKKWSDLQEKAMSCLCSSLKKLKRDLNDPVFFSTVYY